MHPSGFDFYAMSDAAIALAIPRSNLRYFIDTGKVPAHRASDGSRLMSHDDIAAARALISEHEAKKARAKTAAKRARDEALKKISAQRTKSKQRRA